ncbi:MAG: exodeoxyribonuclease VII large subunit [Bdellovibrionota bacterium]
MKRYEPTEVFTVSQLTRRVRGLLEQSFPLLWVVGEISNFRAPSSGHWYLTLKDEGAQIPLVMFRGQNRFLRFRPEDGMEVLVRGRLTVYEPRGQYQLLAEHMEPKGAGALQIAFEQLKEKLAKEGLFDPARKRPLPFLPETVGLVTSLSGAVVRDVCSVLLRRHPGIKLLIDPVRVQGEGAAAEIAAALDGFGKRRDVDVVILARGGGSIEDLWAFNEEHLARAIAACPVPVVSAVGHETDFTIADFVADVRAPTPSAAAEMVAPVRAELLARVESLEARLTRLTAGEVERRRLRVHALAEVIKDPRLALAGLRRRLDEAEGALLASLSEPLRRHRARLESLRAIQLARSPLPQVQALKAKTQGLGDALKAAGPRHLTHLREKTSALAATLDALSPLAVLGRGYSVARLPDGRAVRQSSEAPAGTSLDIVLYKGKLQAQVTKSSD